MGPVYKKPKNPRVMSPGKLVRNANVLRRVDWKGNVSKPIILQSGFRGSVWWKNRTATWFMDRIQSKKVFNTELCPMMYEAELKKAFN